MTPWASDPGAVAGDETPTDHSAFERGVCPKFMRRVTYPKGSMCQRLWVQRGREPLSGIRAHVPRRDEEMSQGNMALGARV